MARGRHRKPTQYHRTAARAAIVGAGIIGPVGLSGIAEPAYAGPPGGWGPIIACESSGNPTATNRESTASGLFQFLDSSWRYYGGAVFATRAMFATPTQQTQIAEAAYAKAGLSPWTASRSCWGSKLAAATAAGVPTPAVVVAQPSWQAAAKAYVVQRGDTLSKLAAGRTSWQQLYALNRAVIGSNPNLLLPGQQLLA